MQRAQGCRGHRGAGLRDARSVRHKGAELRVQSAGVWGAEGAGYRGAGLMSPGVQGSGVQRVRVQGVQGSGVQRVQGS